MGQGERFIWEGSKPKGWEAITNEAILGSSIMLNGETERERRSRGRMGRKESMTGDF